MIKYSYDVSSDGVDLYLAIFYYGHDKPFYFSRYSDSWESGDWRNVDDLGTDLAALMHDGFYGWDGNLLDEWPAAFDEVDAPIQISCGTVWSS